ncbi:MAG: hypothetical protein IVW52_15565 [Acidimicrobiales bacterium]|nr:hypothetical protein [Acidimicrobiales bacterium]
MDGSWFDGVVQVGDDNTTASEAALFLSFDQQGFEVVGPGPGQRRRVPWTAVARVSLGVTHACDHGGFVTPIEVGTAEQTSLFLLPSERPESVHIRALDRQLATWSTSEGGHSGAPVTAPAPPGLGPYGLAGYGSGAYGVPPAFPAGWDRPRPVRPRRTRRKAMLVIGSALVVAGVGLALALSDAGSRTPAGAPGAPRLSSDQQLADQLMLSRNDLPRGWTVNTDSSGSNSQQMRTAEAAIANTFAGCMGITDQQGAVVLGGPASDQTAHTSSPVFVAPASAQKPGFAFELQTSARIVRTHRDEQDDAALYANSRYPQCVATAVAAEVQLGANSASGQNDQPGPASASVVDLHAPAGEQLSGLLISFTVSDGSTPVPVEVEDVSLGTDRIEADLQAFSVGGEIPRDVLSSSVWTFEQRVASRGTGLAV